MRAGRRFADQGMPYRYTTYTTTAAASVACVGANAAQQDRFFVGCSFVTTRLCCMATSLFSSANGIRFHLPLLPDARSLVVRYSVTLVTAVVDATSSARTVTRARAALNSVAKSPKAHHTHRFCREAHLQQSHTSREPTPVAWL